MINQCMILTFMDENRESAMKEFTATIKAWAEQGTELGTILWEELPDIKLYMDQVITLLGDKLKFYERDESSKLLTSSMINNYVKSGLIPHPEKKKYDKEQLASLIVVCMLKAVLPIPEVKTLFEGCEDKRSLFEDFEETQTDAINQVSSQVRFALENGDNMRLLAMRLAAEANAKRAAAEKILFELGRDADLPGEKTAKTKQKKAPEK